MMEGFAKQSQPESQWISFAKQSKSIAMDRLCEAKPIIIVMERLCEAKRACQRARAGAGGGKHCRAPDGFSGDLHYKWLRLAYGFNADCIVTIVSSARSVTKFYEDSRRRGNVYSDTFWTFLAISLWSLFGFARELHTGSLIPAKSYIIMSIFRFGN